MDKCKEDFRTDKQSGAETVKCLVLGFQIASLLTADCSMLVAGQTEAGAASP